MVELVELTLNLIWAAVALSAFVFVLPRTRPRWAGGIALACILVLLFPIISVSDDLSAQWESIEEATAVRRDFAGAHASVVHHVPAVQAILPSLLSTAITVALHGAVECHLVPTPAVLLAHCTSPRSPPRCQ